MGGGCLASHGFGDGVLGDADDGGEAAGAAALAHVRKPAVLRDLGWRQRGHCKTSNRIMFKMESSKQTTITSQVVTENHQPESPKSITTMEALASLSKNLLDLIDLGSGLSNIDRINDSIGKFYMSRCFKVMC